MSDQIEVVELLPADPPDALQQTRREPRMPAMVPLELILRGGEIVAAIVLDVGPSGLSALIDRRSSPALPPPLGEEMWGRFFLDELTFEGVKLVVRRVEPRDEYHIELGCSLEDIGGAQRTALRAKATRAGAKRTPKR